jgi:hypothetical protein
MAKGGARPGAGRPKAQHTVEAEAAKARLVELFVEEKDEIFAALIKKAKRGDVPALKELFERVWGKPVQPIGNDDTGQLTVKVINYGNSIAPSVHAEGLSTSSS